MTSGYRFPDGFLWGTATAAAHQVGYEPTFGIVAVDRRTQERTVKPSGRWLGQVAAGNALP